MTNHPTREGRKSPTEKPVHPGPSPPYTEHPELPHAGLNKVPTCILPSAHEQSGQKRLRRSDWFWWATNNPRLREREWTGCIMASQANVTIRGHGGEPARVSGAQHAPAQLLEFETTRPEQTRVGPLPPPEPLRAGEHSGGFASGVPKTTQVRRGAVLDGLRHHRAGSQRPVRLVDPKHRWQASREPGDDGETRKDGDGVRSGSAKSDAAGLCDNIFPVTNGAEMSENVGSRREGLERYATGGGSVARDFVWARSEDGEMKRGGSRMKAYWADGQGLCGLNNVLSKRNGRGKEKIDKE
ncbi:hypothetical protein BDV93DRAFT_546732 [Ceratobasidium sp. AG-I]|nr:hypothetical protein BDV93DRAFT_546732 [Ceratobasidium sp. AG-I]